VKRDSGLPTDEVVRVGLHFFPFGSDSSSVLFIYPVFLTFAFFSSISKGFWRMECWLGGAWKWKSLYFIILYIYISNYAICVWELFLMVFTL
jgi:hypothetical protein